MADPEGKKSIGTECPKCGGLSGIIGEPDIAKKRVEISCQTPNCGNKFTTAWPPKAIPAEEKRAREKAARRAEASAKTPAA